MGMGADTIDTGTNPRAKIRIPFRRQLVTQAPDKRSAPAGLAFAPATNAPGSDRDVLMGYQIFLGRDPENSHVMMEAKASPLRGFISGLMLSGEFESSVLQPLARRQPMPHERSGAGPAQEQTDWLNTILTLPPAPVRRGGAGLAQLLGRHAGRAGISARCGRRPGGCSGAGGAGRR